MSKPDQPFALLPACRTSSGPACPTKSCSACSRIRYRYATRPSLTAQVKRMLKDPKAKALVENFAGQWLELRRLESVAPDREKFPEFDDYLRMSMRQETEMFFENLIRKTAASST